MAMAMEATPTTLELTLMSATDLKDMNLLTPKMEVYAVVSLSGGQSRQVPPDRKGGRNPTWDVTLQPFAVPATGADSLTLRVLLRADDRATALGDLDVGEVNIQLSDLLREEPAKCVAYPVCDTSSGKTQGTLNLSYKLREVTHTQSSVVAAIPARPAAYNQAAGNPPSLAAYLRSQAEQPAVAERLRGNNFWTAGMLGPAVHYVDYVLNGDMTSAASMYDHSTCGGGPAPS